MVGLWQLRQFASAPPSSFGTHAPGQHGIGVLHRIPPLVNALHARLLLERGKYGSWAYGKWHCASAGLLMPNQKPPPATAATTATTAHGDPAILRLFRRGTGPFLLAHIFEPPFRKRIGICLRLPPSAQRAFDRELRRECRLRFIQGMDNAWSAAASAFIQEFRTSNQGCERPRCSRPSRNPSRTARCAAVSTGRQAHRKEPACCRRPWRL